MKKNPTLAAGCTMIILCLAFASCTSSGKLMTSNNQPDVPTEATTKLKKTAETIVTIKDDSTGSVYISVDGKMLFGPGSSTVYPKGMKALKPLGKMLYEADENFSIMIKTNTESEELAQAKFADNWSLSQARANTVMRILTASAMQMAQKANDKKVKPAKEEVTGDSQNTQPVIDKTDTNSDSKKYILVLVNSL